MSMIASEARATPLRQYSKNPSPVTLMVNRGARAEGFLDTSLPGGGGRDAAKAAGTDRRPSRRSIFLV